MAKRIVGDIIRQGDVFLIPRDEAQYQPKSGRYFFNGHLIPHTKKQLFPVREEHGFRHVGEGGNHAHVIDNCEVLDTETGARFVRLSQPRVLRHVALHGTTEVGHADVEVPPGLYETRIQREWQERRRPRMVID